jgi:hypothetical protein
MAARECVLRFLAFTLTSPENYKASDFDAFLSEAMNALNNTTEARRAQLAKRLIRALKASHAIFGDAAFRKPRRRSRSAVNKALFEVWTVTMDSQSDNDLHKMRTLSERVKKQILNLMQTDKDFLDAISQGTGDSAKVRLRFSRFRTVLEESIS